MEFRFDESLKRIFGSTFGIACCAPVSIDTNLIRSAVFLHEDLDEILGGWVRKAMKRRFLSLAKKSQVLQQQAQ